MKRVLTALVGIPIALLALFGLPAPWFFVLLSVLFGWVAVEYAGLMSKLAPGAPLKLLVPLVPLAALMLSPELTGWWHDVPLPLMLMGLATAISVGVATAVLLLRTPVTSAVPCLGALAFGIPYLALPIVSLYRLQQTDPWIVFLLMGIVWLGDSAAYYVGRAIGKHKLAPVVSPNKSWEGAAAGFAIGAVMTVVWSYFRLGRIDAKVLMVCAVVAVAAQLGDLAESMMKRGIGVKDSGSALPGHGGFWDRMDAMLFAAPVLDLGVLLVGAGTFMP